MYIIERVGVKWSERFYSGRNFSNLPVWGCLEHAIIFNNKSKAVRMGYQIDDEEGINTRIEEFSSFSGL